MMMLLIYGVSFWDIPNRNKANIGEMNRKMPVTTNDTIQVAAGRHSGGVAAPEDREWAVLHRTVTRKTLCRVAMESVSYVLHLLLLKSHLLLFRPTLNLFLDQKENTSDD